MKFTSIKTDKNKQKHLSLFDVEAFMQRIREDRNGYLIGEYRMDYKPRFPKRFRRYAEIPSILAAVELCRQPNGALGMKAFNGLVVLEVKGLMSEERCEEVKKRAMALNETLATFTGATGQDVVILVRVARADGSLPTSETEAETFYTTAYAQVARLYDAVLPEAVTRMTPQLRHAFLLPLDTMPLYNANAKPLRITPSARTTDKNDSELHLLAQPEQRDAEEVDMTAYMNYERAYQAAVDVVSSRIQGIKHYGNEFYKQFITAMATELYASKWPEEETVCHLWQHLVFKDEPGLTEDFVRTIVNAVYAEENTLRGHGHSRSEAREPMMQELIRRMESRYVLRYNTIMGYVEYRSNHTWVTPWAPVTDKVINTFTTDLQIAGMSVWDRDVKRYINSTRIREFNPIEGFMYHLDESWDGRDHIGALAATVPTSDPSMWRDCFHRWFLAMVAQWLGRNRHYGNAIVPLLVSAQGMHKSAFCRSLLPPELRSWGYTDNLSLAEERPVHLAMAQMLLINLDEFNRISPQKQQGFLKNIVQLPSVKVKRPYASHTEEVPRLASFIATTNIADVLSDPTGSRRFVGIEVTGDIDMRQTPNYTQLYAQALAELDDGVRYWFDEVETAAVMEHNRRFMKLDATTQFFLDFFEMADPEDAQAQWLSATNILVQVKKRAGSTFQAPSPVSFGRILSNLPDMSHRRNGKLGELYCVKPRF